MKKNTGIMKGVVCSTLASMLLASNAFAVAKPNYVNDISRYQDIAGTGAEKSFSSAIAGGVISGTSETTVSPYKKITRAEMAAMLVRAMGSTKKTSLSSFIDISTADWYYDELSKAVAAGIVKGDGNGLMRPEAEITRQEAASILYRAFHLNDYSFDLSRFKDQAEVASWAEDAIEAMVYLGAINPKKDTLDLNHTLNRAEFTAMLYSVVQEYETPKVKTYTGDIEGSLLVTDYLSQKDFSIKGNVFLMPGLGEKTVTLDDVYVEGTVYILAGAGITLKGDSDIQRVVVLGDSEDVTITTQGNSVIRNLFVEDSEIAVTLKGTVDNLDNQSSKKLVVEDSYIKNLVSSKDTIKVAESSTVLIDSIEKKEVTEGVVSLEFNIKNAVASSVKITQSNPIKLQEDYDKSGKDFADNLTLKEVNKEVVVEGNLKKVTLSNGSSGYYVPIRLAVSDMSGVFNAKVNDTEFTNLKVEDTGETVYLNLLVPFTSDYKTAKIVLVPEKSSNLTSISVNMRLSNTARFIK